MNKEIKLPSGATVVFRDPKTLRVKDRNKIYEAAGDGDGGIMQAIKLSNGMLSVLIESWSFDLLIPSLNIDSLGEMELADYDALQEHSLEAQKTIFPNLGKTVENEQDPKADTANSNG